MFQEPGNFNNLLSIDAIQCKKSDCPTDRRQRKLKQIQKLYVPTMHQITFREINVPRVSRKNIRNFQKNC